MKSEKTNSMTIYASEVTSTIEGKELFATIKGYDLSQVINEHNAEAVLDCIDFDVIAMYFTNKSKEEL